MNEQRDRDQFHPMMGGKVRLGFTSSLMESMISAEDAPAPGCYAPHYDTCLLAAIAMIELAKNCAGCTGPEIHCIDAIHACRKAMDLQAS